MARPDPALLLRVPARARRDAARAEREQRTDLDRPRLRLVVTRGRLGVELEAAFALGPLWVEELALSLPDVKFPVELTGGVTAFRHRRGELERLLVALDAHGLAQWGASRLRGVLSAGTPQCVVAPLEDGWLVGLSSEQSAVAFEVLVAPLDGDLRLLPTAARGIGLAAPAQSLAVRVLQGLSRPAGKLVGGAVLIEDAAGAVARELLPLAGVRAPASQGLRWQLPTADLGLSRLLGELGAGPTELTERMVRALELATLAAPAEAALMRGDLVEARRHYLAALERAPRHPELSRRLAEVDACVGERAEAALGTLSEAMLAVEGGVLAAQLLAEVGDRDGALEAYRRAAELEPFGPLAALVELRLAELHQSAERRFDALDRAVARAPSLAMARWRRLEQRLRAGDLRGVKEDAEHLEAQVSGAHARHEVARRVAQRYLDQGLTAEAAERFERALRYVPDDVDAVAGLARSLGIVGQRRRALDLLGRAVALAERAGKPAHRVTLELARALVEVADDRPAAVAQVRRVPPFVAESFEARALEARWRGELGDWSGASVALGRLGDAVEQALGLLVSAEAEAPGPWPELWGPGARWQSRSDARQALAGLLLEGAALQEHDRNDLPAARRLLALALRLAPQNPTVQRAFRRVAAVVDRGPQEQRAPTRGAAAQAVPVEPPDEDERTRPGGHDAPRPSDSRAVLLVEPAPPRDAPSEPTLDEPVSPFADERPSPPARAPTLRPEAATAGTEPPSAPDAAMVDGAPLYGQPPPPSSGGGSLPPMPELEVPDEAGDGEDALLIEQLTERLRGNPDDLDTVRQLAAVLERARRDHDLLALLSARVDDGPPAQQHEFLTRRRVVLERLLSAAQAAGKQSEAELYALMLERSY